MVSNLSILSYTGTNLRFSKKKKKKKKENICPWQQLLKGMGSKWVQRDQLWQTVNTLWAVDLSHPSQDFYVTKSLATLIQKNQGTILYKSACFLARPTPLAFLCFIILNSWLFSHLNCCGILMKELCNWVAKMLWLSWPLMRILHSDTDSKMNGAIFLAQ